MKQRPSHQWYMQDFLGSTDVQMMSIEDVGCYCLLLFNLYVNGGEVEDNAAGLSRLCRGYAVAEVVLQKFYKKDGKIRHKRVDKELEKQVKFSKSQSNNAKKRWKKGEKQGEVSQCDGIESALDRECSSSSSSSSFLSSSTSKKERKRPPKKKFLEFVLLSDSEEKKLKETLGGAFDEHVKKLNNYIGSTGKRYKSHYHTILNWHGREVKPRSRMSDSLPITAKSDGTYEFD